MLGSQSAIALIEQSVAGYTGSFVKPRQVLISASKAHSRVFTVKFSPSNAFQKAITRSRSGALNGGFGSPR